jgi:Raf kinase inhibitor-like YbhB/YbcL family protein
MILTSGAFQHTGMIPRLYTCDGSNINPPLAISDIPPNTQSLVLIMDDPDVPKYIRPNGIWDHWVVFNIPPSTTVIEAGKEPNGRRGIGSGNNIKYYGPCPPEGEHRYFFKLYALDSMLELPEKATKSEVESAMQGHILDKTELMGIYGRA